MDKKGITDIICRQIYDTLRVNSLRLRRLVIYPLFTELQRVHLQCCLGIDLCPRDSIVWVVQ